MHANYGQFSKSIVKLLRWLRLPAFARSQGNVSKHAALNIRCLDCYFVVRAGKSFSTNRF
jgi:hypothetical protein